MIENLPIWINILFLATWLITLGVFYFANGKPKKALFAMLVYSLIQSILAYAGFYQVVEGMPPRFTLVIIPTIIFLIYGLLPKQRRWINQNRNTQISTFLHVIRFPVEIVLWQLFIYKMVPELMTFEGRNFDILAGITAPIIGLLYLKNKIGKNILLIWNFLGLGLILFILFNGIFSAELPIQQFGFEQPNRAVTYFPFILLPAVIVPIVIWTHLSDIIKLMRS